MNNIIYRKAEINDFLQISKLDREGWSQNRVSEFIPDGEHIWRFWVEYTSVFVAEIDSKIVAFANIFKSNTENIFLFHKIVVHFDYRNKSIGQNLFKLLTEELDKYRADCLTTVDPINDKMIHLCEKFGFSEIEFKKGYYRKEEDRYLIKRTYKS